MKTLKNNISEADKVQGDCLKDSGSDSYNKNHTKEKVNDLLRLHEGMQEKLKAASYSDQIQILTLVPDIFFSRKLSFGFFVSCLSLSQSA